MQALIEIMRHAPAGDIVEIGSGAGRSAALLACLAARYGLGHLLCIDSWVASGGVDAEEALRMFEINLAPLAGGRVNWLRARADEAWRGYRTGLVVRTEKTLGETRYDGAVAVPPPHQSRDDGRRSVDTARGARRLDRLWRRWVGPGGERLPAAERGAGLDGLQGRGRALRAVEAPEPGWPDHPLIVIAGHVPVMTN